MHWVARTAWLTALGFALVGCGSAGTQFALPAPGTFVLGKTTPGEVIATVGQPFQRNTSTTETPDVRRALPPAAIFTPVPTPGQFEHFSYIYIDTSQQAFLTRWTKHSVRPTRFLTCTFWNGRLAAYVGSSSFTQDSTDFTDAKIAQLKRGITTGDQVLALFGKPSGGAIYPIISRRDGVAMIYFNMVDDLGARERTMKFLEIYFDKAGIVRDFRSVSSSTPLIITAAAPTSVPIFIPAGRR